MNGGVEVAGGVGVGVYAPAVEPDDFEFAEVQQRPWNRRFWPSRGAGLVMRNAKHPSPGGEGYRRSMRRTGLTIFGLGVVGIGLIALVGYLLDALI